MANAHCAQSGFTQGESASQHFHCRDSPIAAPARTRDSWRGEGGRQTERQAGMQRDRRTRGQAAALIPPQQSPNEADSSPCLSLRLSHNFSPVPSVGCMPPLSLCLPSLTCPHIPLILFLSSITPIHSSSLSAPLPPHLPTRGVYADSGTFVRVFVKIREKFCSAG